MNNREKMDRKERLTETPMSKIGNLTLCHQNTEEGKANR